MRMHRSSLIAIALCLPMRVAPAQAQPARARLEVGTDATLLRELDDARGTSLQLPGQMLRVGYFASPRFSVESSINFFFATAAGSRTFQTVLQPGILLHHSADQTTAQFYLHPFFDVASTHVSYDFGNDSFHRTVTRTGGGIGVGVRIPVAQRLASRFELQYDQLRASSNFGGEKNLKLQIGISYLGK